MNNSFEKALGSFIGATSSVKPLELSDNEALENLLQKAIGDPTHGGKLVPVHVVDKNGHHVVRYHSRDEIAGIKAHPDTHHAEELAAGHRFTHPKNGAGTITKVKGHDGKGYEVVTKYDDGRKATAYVHNIELHKPDHAPLPAEKKAAKRDVHPTDKYPKDSVEWHEEQAKYHRAKTTAVGTDGGEHRKLAEYHKNQADMKRKGVKPNEDALNHARHMWVHHKHASQGLPIGSLEKHKHEVEIEKHTTTLVKNGETTTKNLPSKEEADKYAAKQGVGKGEPKKITPSKPTKKPMPGEAEGTAAPKTKSGKDILSNKPAHERDDMNGHDHDDAADYHDSKVAELGRKAEGPKGKALYPNEIKEMGDHRKLRDDHKRQAAWKHKDAADKQRHNDFLDSTLPISHPRYPEQRMDKIVRDGGSKLKAMRYYLSDAHQVDAKEDLDEGDQDTFDRIFRNFNQGKSTASDVRGQLDAIANGHKFKNSAPKKGVGRESRPSDKKQDRFNEVLDELQRIKKGPKTALDNYLYENHNGLKYDDLSDSGQRQYMSIYNGLRNGSMKRDEAFSSIYSLGSDQQSK
jgi:hypothetical protein